MCVSVSVCVSVCVHIYIIYLLGKLENINNLMDLGGGYVSIHSLQCSFNISVGLNILKITIWGEKKIQHIMN